LIGGETRLCCSATGWQSRARTITWYGKN